MGSDETVLLQAIRKLMKVKSGSISIRRCYDKHPSIFNRGKNDLIGCHRDQFFPLDEQNQSGVFTLVWLRQCFGFFFRLRLINSSGCGEKTGCPLNRSCQPIKRERFQQIVECFEIKRFDGILFVSRCKNDKGRSGNSRSTLDSSIPSIPGI